VVFIRKYRKKTLYGQIRRELGPVFGELARQKECEIIEGHLMVDHVYMLLSIPPKYSVAQVLGFLKGKTAIHIAGCMRGNGGALWGSSFGRVAIGCRRSAGTKSRCVATFRNRRKKIGGWIN
jgi:putative transposase